MEKGCYDFVVREPLRDEITKVALELGREGGEAGLTMRAIARRMGISATALYQHFEGKSAILEQVWVNGLTQLSEALEEPLKIQPCQEALTQMGFAYLRFAQENPWVYDVLMNRRSPDQTRFSLEDAARSQRSFSLIIAAISQGIERGEVPETVIPVRAALHSWASLHGMANHILSGRFDRAYPTTSCSTGEDFVSHYVRNLAYTTTETCPPWFMHQPKT